MNKVILLLALLFLPLATIDASETLPAENDPNKNDRTELKQILSEIEAAINATDFDAMFRHFDDQISISFMTTDVAIGKDAIRDFYKKMFQDDSGPLKSHKTKASLGAPAIFHNNTITAYGRAEDTFELKAGTTYRFDTRWTATAVKKNNQWKVISIHFSVSPFSNPILDELTNKLGMFTISAFVAGLFIAFIIARLSRKKTA